MYYVIRQKLVPLHQNRILLMTNEPKKHGRGGRREGAGRPKSENPAKLYTFRVGGKMAECLDAQENRTDFIKSAIEMAMNEREHAAPVARDGESEGREAQPDFSRLGTVYPATMVKEMKMHFFDLGIVAGFPIPLDNDERAQSIELLKMLCPYPESSYLIRVEGNSMIEANIHSGDIVVVDKSNRNPSESEVAVCELNGEYTLKRFVRRDNRGWLIPANPAYPEIEITPEDRFTIWGTVTYIIHRPQ